MKKTNSPPTPPPDWNEDEYLRRNQDVAAAFKQGKIKSGYDHYLRFGLFEKRSASWIILPDAEWTRDCVDPWMYLEVGVNGELRPCCIHPSIGKISSDGSQSLDCLRNNENFKQLRLSLLQGRLTSYCRSCHIRSMIDNKHLNLMINKLCNQEANVHESLPLQQLRIDLTTICNLKCVYCAVSQPSYYGRHMPENIFHKTLELIKSVPSQGFAVHLNGHGETTCHPKWVDFVQAILKIYPKPKINILSNFAKTFNEREIDTLARLDVIQISLDTIDEDLLKSTRRKVSLGVILRNISRIRAHCRSIGTSPVWSVSSGVYDLNIDKLDDLAWFIIEMGFDTITFWNLVSYPQPSNNDGVQPSSILSFPHDEKTTMINKALKAVSTLQKHGVVVEVAGDFLN